MPAPEKGFTFIEIIIVIAILGIMALGFYPSVLNTLELRALETSAREIQAALQTAKWQAVNAKTNHRVRFNLEAGRWMYRIETESSPGTWVLKTGQTPHSVPTKFDVTLDLPTSSTVEFTPTGFIYGYESAKNQIVLSSSKLATLGQASQRLIRFYAGGSIQFLTGTGE